jgi:hypothetical protein
VADPWFGGKAGPKIGIQLNTAAISAEVLKPNLLINGID